MKVRVKYAENLHFKGFARHFESIDLDEPESFNGTDIGPSPIEYYLMGIGGCIGATFAYCLQKKKGAIKELEIIVNGELKHMAPKLRLKLAKIEIKIVFSLKQGVSIKIIDYCKSKFQEYCPLSESVINGIPLTIKFLDSK